MATIVLRRGTASQWSTSNPVLAAGEPGYATDTGVFKIGNGTTSWNSLPAIGGSPGNFLDTTGAMIFASNSSHVPNGYSVPGIYRRESSGNWVLFRGAQPGVPFKTISPSGSGSASRWTNVAVGGFYNAASSLSLGTQNLSAGQILVIVMLVHGGTTPTINTPSHNYCSGWNILVPNLSLSGSTKQVRVAAYQASCTGGSDTFQISFTGSSWFAQAHLYHVPSSSIGNFLGYSSVNVNSNTPVTIQRNDSNAQVAMSFVGCTTVNSPVTVNASNWNSNIVRTSHSSYERLASTGEAGSINNVQQSFTLSDSSNFDAAIGAMMQWSGPVNQANYTVVEEDLGKKLIFTSGNPVLTLPSGLSTYTDIEEGLILELEPSTNLTINRGSGATFIAGVSSGNVSSASISTSSTERKIVTLTVRNGGFWMVTSGNLT
ncbi:MAG: hypothetical protein QXO96_05415 [Sulfolobales archaeon]